jgi:hypothetical protein
LPEILFPEPNLHGDVAVHGTSKLGLTEGGVTALMPSFNGVRMDIIEMFTATLEGGGDLGDGESAGGKLFNEVTVDMKGSGHFRHPHLG